MTAEEIAVKRFTFLFLLGCSFFLLLPVLLAFSGRPDCQKTFYYWVALTHRAEVVSHVQCFFSQPLEFVPAHELWSTFLFSPRSLVLHWLFFLPAVTQALDWKRLHKQTSAMGCWTVPEPLVILRSSRCSAAVVQVLLHILHGHVHTAPSSPAWGASASSVPVLCCAWLDSECSSDE